MASPLNEAGKFNCKVIMPTSAALLFTTSKGGTDGITLDIVTDCGKTITHTVWLSPKAWDRAIKTLTECFGFDGDFRKLANTLTFPNLECSIETEMEDFTTTSGKVIQTCKVKWLNPAKGASAPSDVRAVLGRLETIAKKDADRASTESFDTEW